MKQLQLHASIFKVYTFKMNVIHQNQFHYFPSPCCSVPQKIIIGPVQEHLNLI